MSASKPTRGPLSLQAFVTAFVVVTVVVVGVFFAAYQTCGFQGCPSIEKVRGYVPDEASVVLDRDGEEIDKLYRVNRVVVGLDSLPDYVPEAFIATEDQDFYHHGGVDWKRVLGAAWQNLRSGGIEEGFSTITMQVARNLFPDKLPIRQRTLTRKLSEIRVARELESRYSKDDILELYLNQIYFGSGAWGIEAASEEYFGKPATDLSLGEAALLAGLPQAPSRLNPRENMDGALQRRKTVLRRMQRVGFITAAQAREAGASKPEMAQTSQERAENVAYFVEHVRRLVEERLGDEVYTGGYTIHTTLDLDAQTVASREIRDQLKAIEDGRYGHFPHPTYAATLADSSHTPGTTTPYLQGAVVVMAAGSGDVLALVGGRNFEDSKFDRAIQARRQPGSAFKPFVYAAAIQAGYPPTTVLADTPFRLVQDGRVWEPKNYGNSYAGDITMREALVHSKNVATIRLAEQVGIDRVIDMAHTMGVSENIPPYPSIAIGAADVSLVEMVDAYATLASLGDHPQPRYITSVTDRDGHVVWQVPPRTPHVLDSDVAFLTLDLMRDVVDRGTGAAVRRVGFTAPAAGKTGTTNESADAWFLGFTPKIVTGVWIGMDDPQPIMPRATGGRLAAPVWGRIMRKVATSGADWTPPPGITQYEVDDQGDVIGQDCPAYGPVHEEYFIRGTVNPYDCGTYRYGGYPYGDSLRQNERDSWWRRLRDQVFHDREAEGAARDSARAREDSARRVVRDTLLRERRHQPSPRRRPPETTPPDTGRLRPQPPDTLPRRGRDTLRLPTARPDTVPPDTLDPDTLPRPRPRGRPNG